MSIIYPYLPEGKTILYVGESNVFMTYAKEYARKNSLDEVMPGAAVIVKKGEILGSGSNGSIYHKKYGCERVRRNCKSGEGYELCEGCSQKNHSEIRALEDCASKGKDVSDGALYLWGHWWFCKDCWDAMLRAGIKNVFLLEKSEILFNKEKEGNIVSKQFA